MLTDADLVDLALWAVWGLAGLVLSYLTRPQPKETPR